ncbi:MAG TPA: anthranilate phosphoribosyltransferase [Terriglobia bacterium]|nr:anthranilate phosphoribosyltransferase [Terriglobia bacterium]
MTIRESIETLGQGRHLSSAEAQELMEALLSGRTRDDEIVALLTALKEQGETAEELVGFASVMRARAREVLSDAGIDFTSLHQPGPLLDTCGTGGDHGGTFNVSTATALVAAAAGARVAKHGNRSISSRCGSADVLEALGVVIDLPLARIPQCLEETGFVFLFAPHLHLAMKHVMGARRSMKTKTIFNLLGPLTNPLGATAQLTGIYDRGRTEMMARALAAVGTRRALVVTSHDGLDEISISAPTQMSEAHEGELRTRNVAPEDFGLIRYPAGAIAGGDAQANARTLVGILEGERGPYRHSVLANASAALVVAGVASDFLDGVERAAEAIDSGEAGRKLNQLVQFSRNHRR